MSTTPFDRRPSDVVRAGINNRARARFGDLPGVTAFDPLSDNNG